MSSSRLIVININSRSTFLYTSCSTFAQISFMSCRWSVIMIQISSTFIEKRSNESFVTSKTHLIFDSFISTISSRYSSTLTRIEARITIHVEASSITCLTSIAIRSVDFRSDNSSSHYSFARRNTWNKLKQSRKLFDCRDCLNKFSISIRSRRSRMTYSRNSSLSSSSTSIISNLSLNFEFTLWQSLLYTVTIRKSSRLLKISRSMFELSISTYNITLFENALQTITYNWDTCSSRIKSLTT